MSESKTISIALLCADTPPQFVVDARGDYTVLYTELLSNALAKLPRHDWQDRIALDVRPFDVVKKMEYPDEGALTDGLWDAVMISGSASSAYADNEWTTKLADFLRNLAESHPLVRIIGICYGHQIVARALGGEVALNPNGWELGSHECELTEAGRELLGYPEDERYMRIQEVHRDAVVSVPDTFDGSEILTLASTPKTPFQSLALLYPTPAPPLPSSASTSSYVAFDLDDNNTPSSGPSPLRSAHVLTVQGHPEFDEEIVKLLIDAKTEMGTAPEGLRGEALQRAEQPHDGIRVGMMILMVLGVEPARSEEGDSLINL